MNTLKAEAALAEKYGYKPLPKDMSEKMRQYYKNNIPNFLHIDRANEKLYMLIIFLKNIISVYMKLK